MSVSICDPSDTSSSSIYLINIFHLKRFVIICLSQTMVALILSIFLLSKVTPVHQLHLRFEIFFYATFVLSKNCMN